MGVRIAAETLSNSVASAMQYLMDNKQDGFSGSSATIRFVRLINNCFDIMNTKRIGSENQLENPIDSKNKAEIFAFFDNLSAYLPQVKFVEGKFAGKYIIDSVSNTSFKGLLINMFTFRSVYEEYVETNLLPFLPNFKFSQDHLESFFGRIRSSPGDNDNPTVLEFVSAFNKIIVCIEIVSPESANCTDNLSMQILSVSSTSTVTSDSNAEDLSEELSIEHLIRIKNKYELNEMLALSIAYIASTIESAIISSGRFSCGDCYDLIFVNAQYSGSFVSNNSDRVPLQSIFDICAIGHKYVENLAQDASYTYNMAKRDILHEFDASTAFPETNFEGHEEQKAFLIEHIVTNYIRIQATYIAKRITLKEKQILTGNYYRKIAHFVE